ncbi:MAG: hypothetical protein JW913_20795 [Chitinispirillaceae bacterium]|nr:hypothetical protein [Chitinispirillaceae bacterium]
MALLRRGFFVVLLTCALFSSSFGIAGVGIHWGNDFTLRMEDVKQEWLGFESLTIDTAGLGLGLLPAGMADISGKDLPIFLSRTDWQRSLLNGGLKVYVDVIPFIDAIELSTNFGLWQYKGSISYPTGLTMKNNVNYTDVRNPEDLFTVDYDTIPLTLEEYDMGFAGLRETPYMKLQFDLTVRKYIVQFPKTLKVLRLYGGGGFSLNFATPVLHRAIIEEALGTTLEKAFTLEGLDADLFSNDELMKEILKEILGSMMTPHFGLHIDLGVMLKIPVMPLGFYVDGKFLIPFDDMDPNVDLGGFGILLNSGICLSF